MRYLSPLLAAAAVALWATGACTAHADEKFKIIHPPDLEAMLAAKDSRVAIFDANGPETREKMGIIPGAKLLSSFNKYDIATELPKEKDTPLVFYCANTH